MENAYKQYIKTRPVASADSCKRVKELDLGSCSVHPLFKEGGHCQREDILDRMKSYRPQGVSILYKIETISVFCLRNFLYSCYVEYLQTIFEICGKNKSQEYLTMKEKRAAHKDKIETHKRQLEVKQTEQLNFVKPAASSLIGNTSLTTKVDVLLIPLQSGSTSADIEGAFDKVIVPKKRKMDFLYQKKPNKKLKIGGDVYVPYAPDDQHTEKGLVLFLNGKVRLYFACFFLATF